MLEKIDLNKKIGAKEYKQMMEELVPRLSSLQRQCKEAGIPIVVLFEGWGASGKGTMISELIAPLDPRGFKVFTVQKVNEEESMRPFMWRFWTKLPAKGRIHILDRSWYQELIQEAIATQNEEGTKSDQYSHVQQFEEELTSDGMLMVKFFLHISKKEQKKRFEKLESSGETDWRVSKHDWKQNQNYDDYVAMYDKIIAKTDTDYAPWNIIEATDREYASAKVISTVIDRMQEALAQRAAKLAEKAAKAAIEVKPVKAKPGRKPKTVPAEVAVTEDVETIVSTEELMQVLKLDLLHNVDMTLSLEKKEYKKKLDDLQKRLSLLHYEMYRKRIPVVLAFEGWDAGGKGGAIKRVTQKLDPRGYEVVPVAAPNDIEKAHHYLWRFWNAVPKAGHMAIFDRTWYGRVMVERIEGFCSEAEWKRAYKEINDMEENMTDSGCIVLKFWMNIDKEEQLKRFTERQENPDKQWKITEEDWRNREKWDQYEEVVNEMLVKTSTMNAPWIVVEANDKYYARIKVLESVVEALEKRM